MNHKRTYRLYRDEGLQLRRKVPRWRVKTALRDDHAPPSGANDLRAMDFTADQTFDERKLRILTIVDAATRLCPAIDVRATYRGADVVETLERVTAIHGRPKRMRTDQRTEFTSNDMDLWAWEHGVVMDFSRPGKPTDDAFAEPFNSCVRAELLSANWFLSLADARAKCAAWRESTTRHDPVDPSAGKPRWSKRRPSSGYPRRRVKEPARFSSLAVQGRSADHWFLAYVQHSHPTLKPGDIVIVDNLAAHESTPIRDVIEADCARLLFLPPDLNSIENAFAKLKALLRKAAARSIEQIWCAITRIIQTYPPQECANHFAAAGYDSD